MGKFKTFLTDQFYKGFKVPYRGEDNYIEVFKNPSKKEIEIIKKYDELKSIRIGIKGNDIYCWASFILHDKVEKYMNIKFDFKLLWDDDFEKVICGSEGNRHIDLNDKLKNKLKLIFPNVKILSFAGRHCYRIPLDEDFYKGLELNHSTYKGYVEVFRNPSKREVDSLYQDSYDNGVRIGVDDKNYIYVWIEDILHDIMQKQLGIKFKVRLEYTKNRPSLFLSSGENKNNFNKNIDKVTLKRLKLMFPNIKDIKESTGKFQTVYEYK